MDQGALLYTRVSGVGAVRDFTKTGVDRLTCPLYWALRLHQIPALLRMVII